MQSSGLTWPVILSFANLLLSSAIVITAFSLLGFMLTRNLRSAVAQTFSILLTCVLIVFAIDIIVPRVESMHAAGIWMRLQWIGIALVPAAYLHFSDAVLRTTGHWSLRRRAVVIASYLFSGVLVLMALFTNLLVRTAPFTSLVAHLAPGPLFPLFVAYFFATGIYGGWNVYRARRRCLTPSSRRRMTYLTVSFAAPGLGVFPYLLPLGGTSAPSVPLILLLSLAANFAVGTMLVVMAYAVTYLGVLSPERVIKHDLVHYLLRGPVVGIVLIVVMLVMPRVELILGLPRDTALIFAVVGVMVLGQLVVNLAKPWIDRLLYPEDREEIVWIQTLDRRLLTSNEVSQFLANILTSLCDLMRVPNGFVMVQTGDGFRVEAVAGDHHMPEAYVNSPSALEMWQRFARAGGAGNGGNGNDAEDARSASTREATFHADTGFWFCPLRSQDGTRLLGLLAVVARTPDVQMDEDERAEAEALLTQAAAAVADRYVQEGVFATLQSILPDLERIQEWRSAVRFAPPLPPAEFVTGEPPEDTRQLLAQTTWQQWVKDALSHYWGGPKLTESPLMDLRLVRRKLKTVDGNLTAALRTVLHEAIERQRPPGDRKLNASEWLVYNILDLRFVQGQRVLDISRRLSMSESDLYRKQRVAVAAVARTLAEMEASLDGEAD